MSLTRLRLIAEQFDPVQAHNTFNTAFGVSMIKFNVSPNGEAQQVQGEFDMSSMLSVGLTDKLHTLKDALDAKFQGECAEAAAPNDIAPALRDVYRLQALPQYLILSTVRTAVSVSHH